MSEFPYRIEALLDQGEFLTRLARSLVRDENAADDLVQEAWLAALQRPPAGDARPWFTVVLRNLTRRSVRAESRQESRERSVAQSELGPSPEEIQSRESVRRLVVEKVLGLPESYRTVVLLRFFENWKPRRIAREMGCPVETIKTRLKRALERLRVELDRENGGQRGVWAVALVHAARMRFVSLPLAKGALLLSTKTKIVAATLLLATLAATTSFLLFAGDRREATGTSPLSGLEGSASAPESNDEGIARPRAQDGRVSAVPQKLDSSRGRGPTAAQGIAEGTVVDVGAKAVPDVPVVFRPRDTVEPWKGGVKSDAGGRFQLEIPEEAGSSTTGPGPWVGVFEPRIEETGAKSGCVLVVAPTLHVSGRVVDEHGAPILAAEVRVELPGSTAWVPKKSRTFEFGADNEIRSSFPLSLHQCNTARWITSSDAQGEFSIQAAPQIATARLVVLHSGYTTDVRDLPTDGSRTEIVLHEHVEAGNRLRGQVVDPLGTPVPSASIFLGSLRTSTREDGRFDLALGDHPDGNELIVVKQGWVPVSESCRAPSPTDDGAWPDPLVLVLKAKSLTIRGRVVDSQGRALPRCQVRVLDPTKVEEAVAAAGIEPTDAMKNQVIGGDAVLADTGGSFELRGLGARSYQLRALDLDSLASSESVAVQAGRTDARIRVDTDVSYPCIAGQVVDLAGNPVANIRVLAVRKTPDGEVRSGEFRTDSEGRFQLAQISSAADSVAVLPEAAVPREFRFKDYSDLCSMRLMVPQTGDLMVEVTTDGLTADEFAVLDDRGARIRIAKHYGGGGWQGPYETLPILSGKSEWAIVPEDATSVILLRDGNEVARRAVQVKSGELSVLKM